MHIQGHTTRRETRGRRRVFVLTVVLAGVVAGLGAGSAAADEASERFPRVAAVQKTFARVTQLDIDGFDGWGVSFPGCALRDSPDGPDAVRNRGGSYSLVKNAPNNAASPHAWIYKFSSVRKAKRVMTLVRQHVSGCLGYHEHIDEMSRMSRIKAPRLGDDRFAFQSQWGTTFDGWYRKSQSVWIRSGRWVLDGSVGRDHGKIPVKKTRAFARTLARSGA